MQTIVYILPELFLSFMIMSLLMVGVFIKKSFKLVNLITVLSLIFATALVINQSSLFATLFNGSYIIDKFSIIMKVLTLSFCLQKILRVAAPQAGYLRERAKARSLNMRVIIR